MIKTVTLISLLAVSTAAKISSDPYGSWERYSFLQPVNVLPGQHERVEKALRGSDASLVGAIHQKEELAKQARGKLAGAVEETRQHANDVARIKHSIAEKQAQLRDVHHKHNEVEGNVEQLERTHQQLVKSVHKTLDPKIDHARAHLEAKQQQLSGETDALKYWQDQERHIKEDADDMIKEEDQAHHALTQLEGEVAWQKQQEDIAENKFHYSNSMAKEDLQSLEYAEDRVEKEMLRLKKAKDVEAAIAQKVRGQDNIHAMQLVEDAERDVRNKEDEADDWKDNLHHIKQQADEMSKENMTAYENLKEAQSQLKWTEQQTALAKKQYKMKGELATQEVADLKHAEHELAAEISKAKVADKARKDAEESVERLRKIRVAEEKRVDATISAGKGKLKRKLIDWEASRETTAREIASLNRQYADWQDSQQKRVQQVSNLKDATEGASKAYETSIHEAFDRGQKEIYKEDHHA